MQKISSLTSRIFQINSEEEFQELAIDIFQFQSEENSVYKNYLQQLGRNSSSVRSIADIPFLPVELFKTMDVISFKSDPQIIFTSSGTTGTERSHHAVADVSLYKNSFLKCLSDVCFKSKQNEF